MDLKPHSRRIFLKTLSAAALAATIPANIARSEQVQKEMLQVWSCGGLADGLIRSNNYYQEISDVKISYTGAFAGALVKSALGGAHTDVFAVRVLELAKKLRAEGKMSYFKPLCFSKYVMITPLGNPAGISTVEDIAGPKVRVALAPDASLPGGPAVMKLLEKAGVKEAALDNAVVKGSCVQRTLQHVTGGKADVAIVENRVTKLAACIGKVEVISIPDNLQPPAPRVFTIGVMESAKNRELAEGYVEFMTSPKGQLFLEEAGFIPAISAKGQKLIEKMEVKDA